MTEVAFDTGGSSEEDVINKGWVESTAVEIDVV